MPFVIKGIISYTELKNMSSLEFIEFYTVLSRYGELEQRKKNLKATEGFNKVDKKTFDKNLSKDTYEWIKGIKWQ